MYEYHVFLMGKYDVSKSVFAKSKRDINTIIWDTEIEKSELANESLEKDTQTFHIE